MTPVNLLLHGNGPEFVSNRLHIIWHPSLISTLRGRTMSSVYHENRPFGEYGQMSCGDGVWLGLPWWCCSYRHRNSGPSCFAAGRTLIDVGSSFIVVRASSTFIQTAVTVTSLDDVILDHWSEHSWHWWECSYLESNYVCVLIKTYMDFVFQKQRSFYFF